MLKNYQYFQKQSQLILRCFMASLTSLLLIGISVSPISWKNNPHEMLLQVILITCILISLFFYIVKGSDFSKTIFTVFITLYIYVKFWTFPETAAMFNWLAITPLFTIFIFNQVCFFVVAILNVILGPLFILIIANSELRHTYEYISLDVFGNILNFLAIQVILFFVFLGTKNRIETLEAFYLESQQAKQLNSIGQLAATIAHEIRNPITVVKGFAQLFHEKDDLNEMEKYYIETILKELEYTQVIINDYLSLAKPHTDHIVVVELNKEIVKITELLTSFANTYSIGIQHFETETLYIKINPMELKQVLVNIIKNGIESMDKAGFILIDCTKSGDFACIRIKDTGVGMSKEILNNIGTPFYSLKERGTGIGLTLCYSIVTKYKGKITVQSEKNIGTTFSIYLPLYSK